MTYFIFTKDSDNIENTIYRIAENQIDFNNLNIEDNNYKIIQDSIENFNLVKLNKKFPIKYNGDIITYVDANINFIDNFGLKFHIDNIKYLINCFLKSNPNDIHFDKWNNYLTQINALDLKNITYPLNKSLEQYFNDLNMPVLNPLQLP